MNVRLLRKVKKHILEEPRRFAMGLFRAYAAPVGSKLGIRATPDLYNAKNEHEQNQVVPKCGTVACIGGWIEIFGGTGENFYPNYGALIDASQWPDKFRTRYAKAKAPLTRAKIAAERIEHFIATKGRE